jgi:hypothetical protein
MNGLVSCTKGYETYMNLPANRFPSGPAYWSEPALPCGVLDCREACVNEEDFLKCEVCSKRFCPEHLTTLSDLLFCNDCRKCACRATAVALCADCGDLTCAMCSRPDGAGGRLCNKCKHNPDPADGPREMYDADNGRCL